jgi:hypothetical protein
MARQHPPSVAVRVVHRPVTSAKNKSSTIVRRRMGFNGSRWGKARVPDLMETGKPDIAG